MKSTIYLIRHGITEGNKKRWFYGSTDIGLEPEGVENLKKNVAEGVYPDLESPAFYTSGMRRTIETLKNIFGEVQFDVIEELREMDFGIFECKTYDEIKDNHEFQKWMDDKEGDYPIAGGESKKEFNSRVWAGYEKLVNLHRLQELAHRHDKKEAVTVCVCHGGVIASIMMDILEAGLEKYYTLIPDPGRGYILDMKDGKCVGYSEL